VVTLALLDPAKPRTTDEEAGDEDSERDDSGEQRGGRPESSGDFRHDCISFRFLTLMAIGFLEMPAQPPNYPPQHNQSHWRKHKHAQPFKADHC